MKVRKYLRIKAKKKLYDHLVSYGWAEDIASDAVGYYIVDLNAFHAANRAIGDDTDYHCQELYDCLNEWEAEHVQKHKQEESSDLMPGIIDSLRVEYPDEFAGMSNEEASKKIRKILKKYLAKSHVDKTVEELNSVQPCWVHANKAVETICSKPYFKPRNYNERKDIVNRLLGDQDWIADADEGSLRLKVTSLVVEYCTRSRMGEEPVEASADGVNRCLGYALKACESDLSVTVDNDQFRIFMKEMG